MKPYNDRLSVLLWMWVGVLVVAELLLVAAGTAALVQSNRRRIITIEGGDRTVEITLPERK